MKRKIIAAAAALVLLTGCGTVNDKNLASITTQQNSINETQSTEAQPQISEKKTTTVYQTETNTVKQQTTAHTLTDEEICKKALDYYEKKNNYRPSIAEIDRRDGDNVIIHLYDIIVDDKESSLSHTATSDWYTVNVNTLKGIDFFEREIDIN